METWLTIHKKKSARNQSATLASLQGFTLIELLVAIGVASILISIAMPSFKTIIEKNRIASITNGLIGALAYARNEAITRNQSVVFCRSDNPAADAPSCASSGTVGWETGWIAFVDADNDRIFSAGDSLLRVYASSPPNYTINASGSIEWIAFNANGNAFFDNAALGTTFRVAHEDEGSSDAARSVVVSSTGRTRLEDGAS
ncbi:MAG: GspH/FimT family pseudopilin [Burkholderiaceae bacterium]